MASPLKPGKQPVKLAGEAPRVSKIRRDPPPVVKPVSIEARDDRDRRLAAVGILVFALAIVVLVIAFGSWAGWSPSQYTVDIKSNGAL
jgi:hypothetical protein